MTRTRLICLALALAAGCNKPTDENCRKAIANMQRLLGTEYVSRHADLEGEVRRCKGGSSRASVDCAITAQSLDELRACGFTRLPTTIAPAAGSAAPAAGSAAEGSAAPAAGSAADGSAAPAAGSAAAGSAAPGSPAAGSAAPAAGSAAEGSTAEGSAAAGSAAAGSAAASSAADGSAAPAAGSAAPGAP